MSPLLLVVQILAVKATYDGVTFNLGALLEGQMWSLIPIMVHISLIIGCKGLDVKTTYGKSCAPNFWVQI